MIRFIVDSADKEALPVAREELHVLLEKPALEGIPLLVLGNKSDLPDHLSVDELIEALNLKAVTHREVSCYGISAKEETMLDAVLQWLIARASKYFMVIRPMTRNVRLGLDEIAFYGALQDFALDGISCGPAMGA